MSQTQEQHSRLVEQAQFSYDFRHKELPDYSSRLQWRRENRINDFPADYKATFSWVD